MRRKPMHRGFECTGCGRRSHRLQGVREREIRDLSVYHATLVVEVHRLRCPDCGLRVEKIGPTVRAIDLRYLKRWDKHRGKSALKFM